MLTEGQKKDEARKWLSNANDACRSGDFTRAKSYLKEASKYMGFVAKTDSDKHLKAVYKMTSGRVNTKK